MIKFVVDTCISAVIAAAVFWLEWRYVSAHGTFFIWMIIVPVALFIIAIILAMPYLAILAFGLTKRRFGFVLGPILAAAIGYGAQSSAIQREDEALARKRAVIAELAAYKASPVRADHSRLAVDDHGSVCDDSCITVLATSAHTLALRGGRRRGDHGWMLYAQVEGPPCFTKENARLALQFLLRGYPGRCATKTPIANVGDSLLLRESRSGNPGKQLTPDMPEGFTGSLYETIERTDGQDRLLARHIKGSLQGKLSRFPLWKEPPGVDAGPAIDKMIFLANAIGRDVPSLRQPANPFPFDEVLTGIEAYFDGKETIDAETLRSARWTWLQIAANASLPQPQVLKERILRLFASHDPFRTELGIEAMSFMRLDARTFPDDVMLDLVFVPISNKEAISSLEKQFDRQYVLGRTPAPDEVRDRARAHLSDPGLQPWQAHALNQMINQIR